MVEKSANQLWRESGTTLSFKDWLNREKTKYMNATGSGVETGIIVNKPLNEDVQKTLAELKKDVGYKTESAKGQVFGIKNTTIIITGVVILSLVGLLYYQKNKK